MMLKKIKSIIQKLLDYMGSKPYKYDRLEHVKWYELLESNEKRLSEEFQTISYVDMRRLEKGIKKAKKMIGFYKHLKIKENNKNL